MGSGAHADSFTLNMVSSVPLPFSPRRCSALLGPAYGEVIDPEMDIRVAREPML